MFRGLAGVLIGTAMVVMASPALAVPGPPGQPVCGLVTKRTNSVTVGVIDVNGKTYSVPVGFARKVDVGTTVRYDGKSWRLVKSC